MKVSIEQVDWSLNKEGAPIIHIFGRDEGLAAQKIDVYGFAPYFYIPKSQAEHMELPSVVYADKTKIYKSIKNDDLIKVYAKNTPIDVSVVKNLYQHYEGDISYPMRFLIDCEIKSGIEVDSEYVDWRLVKPYDAIQTNPRACMLDIECEDHRGFPIPDRDAIICITVHDSYEDKYYTFITSSEIKNHIIEPNHSVLVYGTEQDMIRGLVQYIRNTNPDIISGWNIDDFDMPYLTKRMEILNLKVDDLCRIPSLKQNDDRIRGRVLFDLLPAYKKLHISKGQKQSYRLDAVAEDELNEKKVRYIGTLTDLLKNDPDYLIAYNKKDVELCVKIERKDRIFDFYKEIARYVGTTLDKTLYSSNVVDIYVLRVAHGKYVLPSKGSTTESEEDGFEGAYVSTPSVGLKYNVAALDLTSLYPSIMMSLNISMDTKDPNGEIVAANGIRFKKSPDGLTRLIYKGLLEERAKKKKLRDSYSPNSPEYKLYDLQQDAIKIIINSYYGISAFKRFRLYDQDLASATTSTGQEIIKHTIEVIKSFMYEVIASDTDSALFETPRELTLDQVIAVGKDIANKVNATYSEFAKKKFNIDTHSFSIKFEKIYSTFLQTGRKKRYCGKLVWREGKIFEKPEIVVTGFEQKRSDQNQIGREVQMKIFELILNNKSYEEIKEYIKGIIVDFRKGKYNLDYIGIPAALSKEVSEYGNDIRARSARYSNDNLNTTFGKGSKPKRIYIKFVTGKYPKTDTLSFEYGEDVPKEFIIDYDLMLEKTIKTPIDRIFEAMKWRFDDCDPKLTTLSMFGLD